METPPPVTPEKVTNVTLPVNPSTTGGFNPDSDPDFDRTVVVKMPGSGMTVFNRYKLNRILGRGGMGVVWLADDLKLERPVALKFLPSLIGLDPAAVKELKTETRRGLELSHPHIVRIYDFVDDEDAAAISMEFVDGKTLSELRMNTEHGVFTTEEISRWLLGVCDALDYAHFQRKVVHRDLKPANIMIAGSDMVAKVADFGIARSLSDTMSRLSAANLGTSGTLPYMSPQQAMGERPLPTDDVYSLGATIYELLSGKPPFYRGDLPMQIRSKVAPSIAERRSELEIKSTEVVPKIWEDAIAACLNKEPNLRPSCAGVLAEMLGLKPSTVSARTMSYVSTKVSNEAKPARSFPTWAAAAAVVVIGGGAGYVFYPAQPTPEAAGPKVTTTQKSAAPVTAEKVEKPKPQAPAPKAEPKIAPVEVVKTEPKATPPEPAVTPASPAMPAPTVKPAATLSAAGASPTSASPSLATVVAPVTPTVASATTMPLTPTTAPGAVVPAVPAVSSPVTLPLPEGVVLPPEVAAQITTQPVVAEPPTGFWNIEQMYPTLPFANYSATGKRYLLFRTQTLLKEKGLYTSTVDGKEGKGTHMAIQVFQAKSSLRPTGMLDVPTLAALQLSTENDNPAWVPPASGGSGSKSGTRRSSNQKEPGFFERTGGKLKSLFGN